MAPSIFLKKHLEALKNKSTSHSSPLAVIGHIDLDAFYAQCEQVRLGLTKDDPVVCRQWSSLIAVSYAARKFGISRMNSVDEARKKCPQLIAPHVATYKKGETTWSYHDNPLGDKHKISLDPFRRESRKIFQLFKKHCLFLEKASIDETFADLGYLIYEIVMTNFPHLAGLDDNDSLPEISNVPPELQFKGNVFNIDRPQFSDWDDVVIMMGSMIIADMRKDLFDTLGYTSSAGIGRNKRIAKLASGFHKPDDQTVVVNSQIEEFLKQFELTDLWGFGGKLGDQVSSRLQLPEKGSIHFLIDLSHEQLESKLGDSLGSKIYEIVRGQGSSEIVTRTDIKSMQSIKQFSRPMQTYEDCHEWFKVFAADIANRILELDGEMESPRRPRTITIHVGTYNRNAGPKKPRNITRSKQTAFDRSVPLDISLEGLIGSIYEQQCTLFESLKSESGESLLPSSSLSAAVSNFQTAKDVQSKSIDNFFSKSKSKDIDDFHGNLQSNDVLDERANMDKADIENDEAKPSSHARTDEGEEESLFVESDEETATNSGEATIACERCKKQLTFDDYEEHKDWHFALDLHERYNGPPTAGPVSKPRQSFNRTAAPSTPKKRKINTKGDQNLLKFFKSA
jgi:DNA polymerase eta